MKKYSKVKKDAIAHYNRMIKWAEKQPKRGRIREVSSMSRSVSMMAEIGEDWDGYYCSYCINPFNEIEECINCPINENSNCCGGLWEKMNISLTWGTWVKRAKLVREYIRKNG